MNKKPWQEGKKRRFCVVSRLLSLFALLSLLLPSLFSCAPAYTQINSYGMGTFAVFTVEDDEDASALVSLLAETENEISFRVAHSPIAKLNGGEEVFLSEDLQGLFALAASLQEQTNGRFSVLAQKETVLWQFDAENPAPPSLAALEDAALETQGALLTQRENGAFSLVGGGIDLGSAGKGYATDVLASYLKEKGKTGLIAVGGSIACVGKKTGDWKIGVRNPFSQERESLLGVLSLREGFVSTSGSYEKRFFYEGKEYHHILDAKTGLPVENELISVTVIATSGALADMLSTAAFILGLQDGFALCQAYGAEAIFVCRSGSVYASSSLSSRLEVENFEVIYR
ncbi:MAG: FAD:protein FMN transferase [Clostridia bacterium]|nr:FAD:protein FMN transferase [Clostridia bacterium]